MVLLAITLCPSVSLSRMITLDNGEVYRDACGPISVGTHIYRHNPATGKMRYIGEVVNTGRAYNGWIVWLWVPESKRIEPKTREAVCQWGRVKVKQSEE